MQKKKILFVGAGGMVASKIIPPLSESYEIVGIAGKRDSLREYCVDFHTGDLLHESLQLFTAVFSTHKFDSIIWNPARFFHSPLIESTREHLLTEFDLGIALPIECLRAAKGSLNEDVSFVIISSTDAFSYPPKRGSYSIIKRAQIDLTGYLARELIQDHIHPKTIALGRVGEIPEKVLEKVFIHSIENTESLKTLYVVIGDSIK